MYVVRNTEYVDSKHSSFMKFCERAVVSINYLSDSVLFVVRIGFNQA